MFRVKKKVKFLNNSESIFHATVGASLTFHGKTTQYANWEKSNCTAQTQACVIVLQNTDSASRTTIDYQNFGWNGYNRTFRGAIHWRGRSNRLSCYECLLVRVRI